MANEDPREEAIQKIADMLRHNAFSFEFKVKKNPKGIKIVYEVSEETMNQRVNYGLDEHRKKKQATENS